LDSFVSVNNQICILSEMVGELVKTFTVYGLENILIDKWYFTV